MAIENDILIKLKAIDELTPVMVKALNAMTTSTAQMSEALGKLNKPVQDVADNTDGLSGRIVTFGSVLTGLKSAIDIVGMAWSKVSGIFNRAIDEALEAEKAQTQLTGALVSTGQYTEDATTRIEAYTDALERNIGVSGEQTKTLIAQATQMGLTVDQALQMEEAARKLAFATGKDATAAFKMLSGAMSGNAVALARTVPQVRELTAAQLRSGEASALVSRMLTEQYKIYEGSFSASLQRAQNGIANVYKRIGEIITQNPLIIRAVKTFGDWMLILEERLVQVNKFIQANPELVERFVTAISQAGTVLGVVLAGMALSTVTLAGALAVLTSPITLLIAAAAGLTAAFAKWPGLFDMIVGGLKNMVGEIIDWGATATRVAAMVASAFSKDLSDSLTETSKSIDAMAEKWKQSGDQQMTAGIIANETAEITVNAVEKENAALDSNLKKRNESNALAQDTIKIYGGLATASEENMTKLRGEAEQRDKDLKSFQDYLAMKTRLSVSQKQEEALQLAALKAEATSDSPEAFEFRRAIAEEQFNAERDDKLRRAQLLGLDKDQIDAAERQMNLEHKAALNEQDIAYWNRQAQINEQAGNKHEAFLARVRANQAKHGKIMGTLVAFNQSEEFKTVQEGLGNMSNLMSSSNEKLFKIGKAAAIAEATVNTYLAVSKALATGGPFLGPILAATALASGLVTVANISKQRYQGGQADEGMDSIPGSLAGKSFVLSQGERVVQPTANRDLTQFLDQQKTGGGSTSGSNYNITLNYNGMGGEEDARKMADIVIKEIRSASERGTPVISSRGIAG